VGGRTLDPQVAEWEDTVALEHLGTPAAPSFGLDTFGDRGTGPGGGQVNHAEALRQVVAEAEVTLAVARSPSPSRSP